MRVILKALSQLFTLQMKAQQKFISGILMKDLHVQELETVLFSSFKTQIKSTFA
jgi:hypothetical protein